MTLPAHLVLSAAGAYSRRPQLSIESAGAQQQTRRRSIGQNGTPDRHIDPAPHTVHRCKNVQIKILKTLKNVKNVIKIKTFVNVDLIKNVTSS